MTKRQSPANKHTKEFESALNKPPHWLIVWGIPIIFFVLMLFIWSSKFISYPETLKLQVSFRKQNITLKNINRKNIHKISPENRLQGTAYIDNRHLLNLSPGDKFNVKLNDENRASKKMEVWVYLTKIIKKGNNYELIFTLPREYNDVKDGTVGNILIILRNQSFLEHIFQAIKTSS